MSPTAAYSWTIVLRSAERTFLTRASSSSSCATVSTTEIHASTNFPLTVSNFSVILITGEIVEIAAAHPAAFLFGSSRGSNVRVTKSYTPRKQLEFAPFLCDVTLLESTLIEVLILNNLKPFRINTYEKQGGGG